MGASDVPVLIVGAGAGGLATSALLASHGVRSLLIEKRDEVFLYPKARNLSFRSLEILRELGLADEVHSVADGVSNMLGRTTLNSTEEWEAFDVDAMFGPFGALSPEPAGQYCPQSAFEPMLLAHLRHHHSEARYGTDLHSFEQDKTGVTAIVRQRDSALPETIRADYLVAADGVHSPIRNTLGVTTSGYGALPIYVVFIYFRAPWRKFVTALRDGDAVQVRNADVEGIFLPVRDDLGMFITTYFPRSGENAAQFSPQRCREVLTNAIGEPIDAEIIDVAPWQPYEQVADQFRSGRVFLVGDSAHTMPPFKAGGANTAIQSAHNLAWKLAAVVSGTADPTLLATYHTERHPVGRFNARQSLTGPALEFLRIDENRPQLPAAEEAPMFNLLIGYQYCSAAVISDDSAPANADALSVVEELRAQPGTRVPHAWVQRAGERVSTLDLIGPDFTLFTGPSGAAWATAAGAVSAMLHVPISAHCISTDGEIRGSDGRWAQLTGMSPDEALLVRPDGFVAWRTGALLPSPENRLREALCRILGRAR